MGPGPSTPELAGPGRAPGPGSVWAGQSSGRIRTRRDGSSPSEVVRTPVELVDRVVHDLAIGRAHGLERLRLARVADLLGDLGGEAGERLTPALPVAADVDPHPALVVARGPALHHGPGELLHRLEGLALGADQQAEVVAGDLDLDGLVVDLGALDRRRRARRPR